MTPSKSRPKVPKGRPSPLDLKSHTRSAKKGIRLRTRNSTPLRCRSARPPEIRDREANDRCSAEETSNVRSSKPFSARKLGSGLWKLTESKDARVPARQTCIPEFQLFPSPLESTTKWDPVTCPEMPNMMHGLYGHSGDICEQVRAASTVSALEDELEKARVQVQELKLECRASKKKLQHYVKKVNEEAAAWKSKEHRKIHTIIEDMKAKSNRERKTRQKLEFLNVQLVNDLSDLRVSTKLLVKDYEKERKGREMIEEICDELTKEMSEDKAEIKELKREILMIREEIEEERKMLQLAEIWREERVQMKLVDARFVLDERYEVMNKLIVELRALLRGPTRVIRELDEAAKAESLLQEATSFCVPDMNEFKYAAPDPDEVFTALEPVSPRECCKVEDVSQKNRGSEIVPCRRHVSKGGHMANNHWPPSHVSRSRKVYSDVRDFVPRVSCKNGNGVIDEDSSEWETMSQTDEHESGHGHSSLEVSTSLHKIGQVSNASGHGMDWGSERGVCGKPTLPESDELGSIPSRHFKASSITKLLKPCPSNIDCLKSLSINGINGRLSNARKSNVGYRSPASLDSGERTPPMGNHPNRGLKGCMEWPRSAQKVKSSGQKAQPDHGVKK